MKLSGQEVSLGKITGMNPLFAHGIDIQVFPEESCKVTVSPSADTACQWSLSIALRLENHTLRRISGGEHLQG